MKHFLHTTILSLTISGLNLPALADATDHACPRPPEAVYYAVDAAWPDQVTEINWDDPNGADGSRDSSLSVTLWREKPLLWNQQNMAGITCWAVRKVWKPNCNFYISVDAHPWYGGFMTCSRFADQKHQSNAKSHGD